MKKAAYNILPETEETLKTMGEQIKLARLRRDLSANLVAERAGISRASLWKVESGNPAVVMGKYYCFSNLTNEGYFVKRCEDEQVEMNAINEVGAFIIPQ